MNYLDPRILDFRAVDDLAFAAKRGRLDLANLAYPFVGHQLGPLLELYQLTRTGGGPISLKGGWLDVDRFSGLGSALVSASPRWMSKSERPLGILKAGVATTEQDWIAFMMDAKRAAVETGIATDWAAQMAAAIGEFHSNIVEHSGARESGFVSFFGSPGIFEFVASDCGVGLLATLREAPENHGLCRHDNALRLALADGASRYGNDQGRGYGFRPLFVGLANREAALRFRSGDACLTIDGTGPTLARSQLGRKVAIGGFFISVSCRVSARP
ncbi:MAG: hypothetical protein GEV13_30570 [Rhodospirillales bacterium]|nr:hypothetical protein [Rhodospirillales bacterium]